MRHLTEDLSAVSLDLAVKEKPRASIRSDGSVLHCVAVSVYCFKMGRITVPPKVVLSTCGFGADLSKMSRIKEMKEAGNIQQFLEGGWKSNSAQWDLPEFETERVEGLEWCRKLSQGGGSAIDTLNRLR